METSKHLREGGGEEGVSFGVGNCIVVVDYGSSWLGLPRDIEKHSTGYLQQYTR